MTTTHSHSQAVEAAENLHKLIDRYWELAHAEGVEGRNHDTEHGAAQQTRHEINEAIAELASPLDVAPVKEKIAPVQGYTPGIPWSLHLEAYDAYCKKWSPQPALIDLEGRNCRGGFGTGELDGFIPGWRDRVSEIGRLKAEVSRLTEALAATRAQGVEVVRAEPVTDAEVIKACSKAGFFATKQAQADMRKVLENFAATRTAPAGTVPLSQPQDAITLSKDESGVVWLHFDSGKGQFASLNLNNIVAERPNTFTTRAMADAINRHPVTAQEKQDQSNLAVADSGGVQGVMAPVKFMDKCPDCGDAIPKNTCYCIANCRFTYGESTAAQPTTPVPGGPVAQGEAVEEQVVFEEWLDRVRPSGDAESVQYQWRKSSEYIDWVATPANMAVGAGSVGAIKELLEKLLLEAELFWWNDGPEGKSASDMHKARDAVLAFVYALATPATEQATTGSGQGVTDAERYQWLNANHDMLLRLTNNGGRTDTVLLRCGDPLDKWIDAAIARERAAILSTASPAGEGEGDGK